MNSATFAAIKFDLPSRIIRQWFGVSANAVLNTRRTQFINHANYKKGWTAQMSQKYRLPHLPTERYPPLPPPPPPRLLTCMHCAKTISRPGMAGYRKSLLTSHSVMEMCFSCFMNTKYKCLQKLGQAYHLEQ